MTIAQQFVVEALESNIKTEKELFKLKNRFSSQHKSANLKNMDLVSAYKQLRKSEKIENNSEFLKLIQKRKIRSESGVAVLTVLTKPYPCPGKCIYCPTEKGMPKSYLSKEPGAQRAVLSKFDPYKQVHNRLRALYIQGHPIDKIEFIVLGGTFNSYKPHYQTAFIRSCYNALNQFNDLIDNVKLSDFNGYKYVKFVGENLKNLPKMDDFETAKKKNETAKVRMIGLTLETRPDWITKKEIKNLRKLGCTRVEIGVQSVYNDVLEKNRRDHTIEEVKRAAKLIKDSGLKLTFHMMPGLYGSTPERDIEMFRTLFTDEELQPDQIKYYPCVVTPFSKLERMWKKGEYKPYDTETIRKIILETTKIFPEYVRISRLIRDIPGEQITAGNMVTNLRQIVEDDMRKKGIKSKDIRFRQLKDEDYDPKDVKFIARSYKSSGGMEHFLSFEDIKQDKILAFLRLRIPSQHFSREQHWISELNNCAIVRELHTYGKHVKISENEKGKAQHVGYGRQLMQKAEEIVKTYNIQKIAVIAGVGVREYYDKQLGYKLEGEYMVKTIG